MNADQYLYLILRREAVDTGPNVPARGVVETLRPAITHWANGYLVTMFPSGSFAKGTANRSGTDIDIFISIAPNVPNNLREIYTTLDTHMGNIGLQPTKQNVSINVRVNGLSVDVVPAKRQDNTPPTTASIDAKPIRGSKPTS